MTVGVFFVLTTVSFAGACNDAGTIDRVKKERLIAFENIYKSKGDISEYLKSFDSANKTLQQMGYFQYKTMRFRNIKAPSSVSKDLFLELNKLVQIEDGFFQIQGYGDDDDEMEIWAIPSVMAKALKAIDKHEKRAGAQAK